MVFKKGQHGVIVGKTGSGKSQQLLNLATNLAANGHRIVVIDTKIDDDFLYLAKKSEKLLLAENYSRAQKILKSGRFNYLVIRPQGFELNNPQALDNYLSLLYKSADLTIFIDEVYQFHSGSGRAGVGLNELLTRGRSRGISLFCCCQRPAWVSKFIFSESTHFFIYQLMMKNDKKTMSGIIDSDVETLPAHHYHYFNGITGELRHEKPINVFKRREPYKKSIF